ncbi:energy transducer TonB [Nibricoccus aquaticus]|nr:energy transducer TonB [Nibricoccus aquaticus]
MLSTPKCIGYMLLIGLLFTAACQTPPPAVVALAPSEIFELSEVTKVPLTITQSPPHYPEELRRESKFEECVLRFVVNTEGRAVNITVVKSTYKAFSDAAVRSVSSWRYKPAQKDGRPVNCVLEIPIIFQTEET